MKKKDIQSLFTQVKRQKRTRSQRVAEQRHSCKSCGKTKWKPNQNNSVS